MWATKANKLKHWIPQLWGSTSLLKSSKQAKISQNSFKSGWYRFEKGSRWRFFYTYVIQARDQYANKVCGVYRALSVNRLKWQIILYMDIDKDDCSTVVYAFCCKSKHQGLGVHIISKWFPELDSEELQDIKVVLHAY